VSTGQAPVFWGGLGLENSSKQAVKSRDAQDLRNSSCISKGGGDAFLPVVSRKRVGEKEKVIRKLDFRLWDRQRPREDGALTVDVLIVCLSAGGGLCGWWGGGVVCWS